MYQQPLTALDRVRLQRHRNRRLKTWTRTLLHKNYEGWSWGSKREDAAEEDSLEDRDTFRPSSESSLQVQQFTNLNNTDQTSSLPSGYRMEEGDPYLYISLQGDMQLLLDRATRISVALEEFQVTGDLNILQAQLHSPLPLGSSRTILSPQPIYPSTVNITSRLEMSARRYEYDRSTTAKDFALMAQQAARRNASKNHPNSMNRTQPVASYFPTLASSGINSSLSAPSTEGPTYNTIAPVYTESALPTRTRAPNYGGSATYYGITSLPSRSDSPGPQYGTITPLYTETSRSDASASIQFPRRDTTPPRYTSSAIELGLDSGMPSQVPRQRPVNPRVRAMQNALASDPNVRAPASRASQSNSLTMHSAVRQSAPGRFPSVLSPFVRAPLMSYELGLAAIIDQTGPYIMNLRLLHPRGVSVVMYDIIGRPITVTEGLILSRDADIKYTVNCIQSLLDEHQSKTERLIIKTIEIRIGTKELSRGYPALEGQLMDEVHSDWAKWVRWDTMGKMEDYWLGYRNLLQLTANSVEKPIFKVRTIRQLPVTADNNFEYGHEFVDVSSLTGATAQGDDGNGGEVQAAIVQYDGGASDTGADQTGGKWRQGMASPSTSTLRPTANPFHSGQMQRVDDPNTGEISLGSADHSGNVGGSSNGGGGSLTASKGKAPAVVQTRHWGHYQRMGGDPRNWDLYDLSHVPFEAKDFPPPKANPFTTPDTFVTIIDLDTEPGPQEEDERSDLNVGKGKGKSAGSEGSITPKASKELTVDLAKSARIAQYKKEKEAALSFADEDDDAFIPILSQKMDTTVNTSIPSLYKMAVSSQENSPQKEMGLAAGLEQYPTMNPASILNSMTSLPGPSAVPSSGMEYPSVGSSTMNAHAPSFTNFQPGTPSETALSPYLQSLSYATSSPYSYSNDPAPARVSGQTVRFSSPPKTSPPKVRFGRNRSFVLGRGTTSTSLSPPKIPSNTNQSFAPDSRFPSPTKIDMNPPDSDPNFSSFQSGSRAAGSSPQRFPSPTKSSTNPPGFGPSFSNFQYNNQAAGSFPERFPSPTKVGTNHSGFGQNFSNFHYNNQAAVSFPQQFPSPTKAGRKRSGFGANFSSFQYDGQAQRFPSPTKAGKNPSGFGPNFPPIQYGSQGINSSPQRFPSPTRTSPTKNFGTNLGYNSGLEYGGDGSQYNSNFEYNGGQDSGFQGSM